MYNLSFFMLTMELGNLNLLLIIVQEISKGRTHWTDPEKTWVSNSSIATYLGVRW